MTHEDYKDMLALHALGALDESDRSLMQEHLKTCPECLTDLGQWRDAAGALAYVAEPAEPSPAVRDRILETVRAENRAGTGAARVIQLKSGARTPFARFPRFAAIAASLILVALVAGLVILWQQNRTARSELARLSAQNESARRANERNQTMLDLLRKPGARIAELAGTSDAPTAHGVLAYDPKSGQAILLADGLPPTPAGKAYQLWFIVGNLPIPGRVFANDSTGKATSTDQLPPQALQNAVFAITQENENGASTPTGPILLRSTS